MKTMLKSSFTKKNMTRLIVAVAGFFLFIYLQRRYSSITPEVVRNYILSFGIFGPLFFLLASALRPLLFFPITVFYLASGLAFGSFWGGIIAISGAIISSLTAHLIARKAGIGFLPMRWRSRICAVSERLQKNVLRNVILIRFIPMVSFDLISYSAGLAGIRLRTFLLGSMIGIAPRVFAYTYVGANIVDINDPRFWIAMGVLVLIFVIPAIVYKILNRKKNKDLLG